MAGLGPNQVRVIIRGAGENGQNLRYVRPFAGFTVKEVIDRLDSGDKKKGGLPGNMMTLLPYYVNGERVEYDSTRILVGGDVFSADGP